MNRTLCAGMPADNSSDSTFENNTLYKSWAIMFILLSAFVIVANAIVIISLLRSHFRDKSGATTNVRLVRSLMMSLAVSDAIIGAFSMPLGIYELFKNGHWDLGDDLCGIKQITDVFLCTVSIYHVVCMAVDRYLAISRPFLYRTLTLRTSFYMIGICWTIPGILCLVLFMNDWNLTGVTDVAMCFKLNDYCIIIVNLRHQIVSVAISFYIPFVVMYVLYFIIAREVWTVYSRTPQFRGRFSLVKGHHYPDTPTPFVKCKVSTNDSIHNSNRISKSKEFSKESKMECSQSMMDIESNDDFLSINSSQETFPKTSDQHSLMCSSIMQSLKRFSPRSGARKLSSSRNLKRVDNASACKTNSTIYNPLFERNNCESGNLVIQGRLADRKPTNCRHESINRGLACDHIASSNCVPPVKTESVNTRRNVSACSIDSCELSHPTCEIHVNHCDSTNSVTACEINHVKSTNRVSSGEIDNEPTNRNTIFLPPFPISLVKLSDAKRPLTETSPTPSVLQAETPSPTPSVLQAETPSPTPSVLQAETPSPTPSVLHAETPSPTAEVKKANSSKSDFTRRADKGNTSSVGMRISRPSRGLRERPGGASGNMKAVWTIGSVVVCFTLCWLPFSIHVVVLSYYNYGLPMWPYHLVTWLGYLNSALNPLLYCCNKSIREAVKSLLFPARENARM